ncbi:DNA topoisomerase III [Pseudomonas corrugata]|uniref:DNA topoisomerase III n=1 Tax=Pseudomonas corrugata TaxID=47879 RepID=UPI001585E92D|nr:DNA topoisomerase III [Pseudomonas corrugata]MCI0997622.1 DNA topoisomerase III [Pseudomonas corrugata]NUT69428.1 DNA topoisomerase III [Pseudomonas corrugata]
MRLFLCEKPSQGKDIARVLGAHQRANGCFKGAGVSVTWCIGHLVEAAPPEAYDERFKRWSLDHLPIIPTTWQVSVKANTSAQYKIVKQLLAVATELVIATDADREGEMIAREVLELCRYKGAIQRLWLSALNEASIRKALAQLRPAEQTQRLYHSALARSRSDWLIGMNMSRLFTLLGRQCGHNGVLSVGRVQTPTLRLVVDRDREIERFTPVAHWVIEVHLSLAGQPFTAQWVAPDTAIDTAGHCIRQAVAQQALQHLKQASVAHVLDVETLRIREAAPLPFDLSTLQEVCSRRLGFGVQQTLDIAQSLYETHKACTYPRTDSGYLPENMRDEAQAVLDALIISDPCVESLVRSVDRNLRSRAWNDAQITAHHGVIPTLEPFALDALSQDERAVYALIRAHYLAQFFPHHEYDRNVARFDCGGWVLKAKGKRIIEPGWHQVLQSDLSADEDEASQRSQLLPVLEEGTGCDVQQVTLKSLKTQAPKAYTQGELIKTMKGVARLVTDPRLKQALKDATGIGTEATRANIISGLLSRGYLYTKGKSVHASEAAFTLIDSVPPAIADPATTAIWEQAFDQIESGHITLDSFLAKQTAWVTQLVEHYRTKTLSMHIPGGPTCPLCGAPMRQQHGKHRTFWSCTRYPDCRGALPVAAAASSTKHRRKPSRSKPPGY